MHTKADIGRIIEFAPNLIYVYDQENHRNAYSNQCLGSTLGYSPTDVKTMGAGLLAKIIHPDDLGSVVAHFLRIRDLDDGQIAALEYRVRHKAGHWVWLLSHDTVYRRDPNGTVTHHVGAASDISAQKQAEVEALAARTKAITINEELKEFAYAISHDMKAPSNTLRLILSELQQEREGSEDSANGQLLDMARITVTRMQCLIEDVQKYTQVIGQEIDFAEVDLNDLFTDLVTSLDGEFQARAAEITTEVLPKVKGCETQLNVLFHNLVHNALKFSHPDTKPLVNITATPNDVPVTITISIRDNGIGIPPEHTDQIFKLFKRLHSQQQYDGSGIGLATCRRIALNHHTTVTLDSHPGEGSTFSIELELA